MREEVTDFNEDNKWSELAIPYCTKIMNEYFKTDFKRSPLAKDLLGSDISNGKINLDVKANRPKYSDENIIIEWDNGWLLKEGSITDYIVWVSNNSIILINYKSLKKVCTKNINAIRAKYHTFWKTSKKDGREWSVQMSKVPMKDIQKHIIAKFDFNWRMI